MKIKFKREKKKKVQPLCDPEENKEEDVLHTPCDEDGKIIFLYKNVTPKWLIEELNNRFRHNKDRGHRGGLLPA